MHIPEQELGMVLSSSENIEGQILEKFQEKNPHKFNTMIHGLIRSLAIEKKEGETSSSFEDRLLSEINKITQI